MKRTPLQTRENHVDVDASHQSGRQGTALLLAIVLCVLATGISASLIRTLALASLRFSSGLDRAQTEELLDAGRQLGQARWREDPSFEHETWRPQLPDGSIAIVQITRSGDSDTMPPAMEVHVSLEGRHHSFSRYRSFRNASPPGSNEGPLP